MAAEITNMPDRSTSLRHFLTVVFKRLWVIVVIVVLTLAAGAFKILRMPDQYQAQAKLLLERDPELEKALLLRVSSGGRSGEANYNYTQEAEIMTSRPVLERVIRSLGLFGFDDTTRFRDRQEMEATMQQAVAEMSQYLSISPSPDPNIIKVRYKSRDPQLCAAIVNELVKQYIDYRFQIFSDDQFIAFLDRQIGETTQQLNELQQKRAQFQSEGTLYSPDREGDLLFAKLKDYESRADALHLQKIAKEARLNSLKALVDKNAYDELPAIDLGEDNARMQGILALKDQLRTLEYEQSKLRQKYTESYSEVREKSVEIKALRERINAEIKEIIAVLESSLAALGKEEEILRRKANSIRTQIKGLSHKELELQQLSRGISENEELYSLLLKQREEAKLSRSKKQMVIRVKIISPATVPVQPIPTNKELKLSMVLLFGIFAGVSFAFFLDFFDHSFKSAEDVQRFLKMDVLASVRNFERS